MAATAEDCTGGVDGDDGGDGLMVAQAGGFAIAISILPMTEQCSASAHEICER
jgi:hypothetical protein